MGIIRDLCKRLAELAELTGVGTETTWARVDHVHPVPAVSSPGEICCHRYYSSDLVRLAKLVRAEYRHDKDIEPWEELPNHLKKFWLDYSAAAKKVMDREQFRDGWSNK